MKDNRTDFAVPGTKGALLVRRTHNPLSDFQGEPRHLWLIVHTATNCAFAKVYGKADALRLGKALFERLPVAVLHDADKSRVAAATSTELQDWTRSRVVENLRAHYSRTWHRQHGSKGARQ